MSKQTKTSVAFTRTKTLCDNYKKNELSCVDDDNERGFLRKGVENYLKGLFLAHRFTLSVHRDSNLELFFFYFSIKNSARLISVMNFIPQINPDLDFMRTLLQLAFGASEDRAEKRIRCGGGLRSVRV